MPAVLRQREHAQAQLRQGNGQVRGVAPQVRWSIAEVVYDKHGEPFDAEAAVRQGIVNYHQNGDDNE